MKEYYTCYNVEEASEILRVSEQSLRRLIRSKTIKASKIGKRYLIPISELDKIILGTNSNSAFHNKEIAYLNEIEKLKLMNKEYEKKLEIMRSLLLPHELIAEAS